MRKLTITVLTILKLTIAFADTDIFKIQDNFPDCPLNPPVNDESVNALRIKMKNHFDDRISELKNKRDDINKCLSKGSGENLELATSLIHQLAHSWAPEPLDFGLTIMGVSIRCSGIHEFKQRINQTFRDLENNRFRLDDISGQHRDSILSAYQNCRDSNSATSFEQCINLILNDNEAPIRKAWTYTCGKVFELDQNNILKEILRKNSAEEFKAITVTKALENSYQLLTNITRDLTAASDNDQCSENKTLVAKTINDILSAGANLVAAAGPPMTSLGALLSTGPLTNLVTSFINGTSVINKFQKSSNSIDQSESNSIDFYTCALNAVQKIRCQIDQDNLCTLVNLETQETSFQNFLKDLKKALAHNQNPRNSADEQTQDDSEDDPFVDNNNVYQAQAFAHLIFENSKYETNLSDILSWLTSDLTEFHRSNKDSSSRSQFNQAGKAQELINKIRPILVTADNFGNLFNTKKTTMNPILQHKELKRTEAPVTNELRELKDPTARQSVEYILKSSADRNDYALYMDLKEKINDFFFNLQTNDLPQDTNFNHYRLLLNQIKNDINQNEYNNIVEAIRSTGSNFKTLNNIISSIFNNQNISKEVNKALTERASKHITSVVDLEERIRFCLIGAQWKSNPSTKANYENLCKFLNRCYQNSNNTIGLPTLDSLPSITDTEINSYRLYCDINQSYESILERAIKEYKRSNKFCKESLVRLNNSWVI
jgi:hypothetical protein